MFGKQGDNTELFQCVTMEALVTANHRLRRLNSVRDLSFVRERVAALLLEEIAPVLKVVESEPEALEYESEEWAADLGYRDGAFPAGLIGRGVTPPPTSVYCRLPSSPLSPPTTRPSRISKSAMPFEASNNSQEDNPKPTPNV